MYAISNLAVYGGIGMFCLGFWAFVINMLIG